MAAADPLKEQIPYNLFREPLEYLFADHVRQKSICALIYELTSALDSQPPGTPLTDDIHDKVSHVIHYLDMELPLHIADEELDILPSLQARALPEDHMDEILDQLGREHAQDEKFAENLMDLLTAILDKPTAPAVISISDVAGRFAEAHCSHMKWENDVLLPLARKRLSAEDKSRIGRSMAARRQVPYPD